MADSKHTVRDHLTATLDAFYTHVRNNKGISPEATIAAYVDKVIQDLNAADVHEGMTLEELAERHDEYKRRLGRLSPPPEGGFALEMVEGRLGNEYASMLARWHRRTGVPFENAELDSLVGGFPDFLRELTRRVRLTGQTPISSANETLDIYADENSALRRNLMWLLGETGASTEVRKELLRRVRSWGTENSVGGCPREESLIDDRVLAQRLDDFIERVRSVLARHGRQLKGSELVELDNDMDYLMPYTERKQAGPTVTDLIREGERR